MLSEVALPQAYRTTPTGLYLISTAWQGKRNVQFAFRALGISDDPPLLAIGIQDKNFSLELIQRARNSLSTSARTISFMPWIEAVIFPVATSRTSSPLSV